MTNAARRDSKDESGAPVAPTDVAADLSTSDPAGPVPDRKVRVLCPYCGRGTLLGARCEQCRGLLDPLSRQATQNSMGPWFIHDPQNPYRPGCSYEVIRDMVRRGKVADQTVLRGPNTRQYWMQAGRCPGVANLLGKCHNCQQAVDSSAASCPSCGADFAPELDRQFLGLGPVHLLPGQAPPEEVARSAQQGGAAARARPPGESAPALQGRGPAATPAESGEYRALVNRMERLDRELGNTRLLLAIASLAVLVLAGCVLYFSGVFKKQGIRSDRWPASETSGSATDSGSSSAPTQTSEAPTTEDSTVQPTMPADPDQSPGEPARTEAPAQSTNESKVEGTPGQSPGTPPGPATAPPPKSELGQGTSGDADGARNEALMAQWATLRGLP